MSPAGHLCRGESVRPPDRDSPIYLGNLPLFLSLTLSPLLPLPLLSPPSSSSLSSSFVIDSVRHSFHAASYPHPWPLLQPTLPHTRRTRMPFLRSSFLIMPARSSVRVRTSSASQSSRFASQDVYSSAIGQSLGQSALPSNLAPHYLH